jgi:hypothetical protein
MGLGKKQYFSFRGEIKDDSILIGSHGDASIAIDGTFELSGIIYCPKYTVTLTIDGTGNIAFRGICNRLVIKKMSGNATLDLGDMTCKELRCESVRKKSKIFAGKTRIVTKANLSDEAVLHLTDKPLITSAVVSGSSRIMHGDEVLSV